MKDKNLLWRKHINKVIQKISQTVSIIGRAGKFMDTPQLVLLYNTMVLPHLQHCLVTWGNFRDDRNRKLRDRILQLQKCFLRVIYSTHCLSHAHPLFARMGSLKIHDLYKQTIRCLSFKLINNTLPARMTTLASRINHSHHTRGLKINLAVNSSNHQSLNYILQTHWNLLPIALKKNQNPFVPLR